MLSLSQYRNVLYRLFVLGFALLCVLLPVKVSHAEGSWQMGLFEGLSYRQPLYETNANVNRSVLRVDVLSAGEVINVLTCGTSNTSTVRVLVYDPNGGLVYNNTAVSNVDCEDDFNHTFDPAATNAHQYVTATTGTYEVHLANFNGSFLRRFDVTVTNSITDPIDPRLNGGRLWSDYWYFWAGSFAQSASTDADLFVVADGGFTGTYFVWKLDLNNFAGYGYGLKANDLGVVSPNAAGDIVAGMSVPSGGNGIEEKYPIYLSYPAKNYPLPTQSYTVSPLIFLDDQNIDSAISSGGNGSFYFSTDYSSTAVYEIIIDTSSPTGGGPDGIYGRGDIFLRGNADPGDNVVPWDGRDNNGNLVPLGAYTAELSVRTGEFHFTADDVETSGGPNDVGLKIYRADPNGSESPTTIYWDDFTVLNSTSPDAFNQAGIYDGDHNWGAFNSGGVGNIALIDTYTFGISVSPNPTGVAIVPDDRPLATLTKSFTPGTIVTGGTSTMQFEIVNNGTTTLTGVTVSDTMPFGMSLVTAPSAITVTGAGCSGFAFSADTIVGGDVLNIIDGTMTGNATCLVNADVTAVMPGDLVNSTSGVTSNELPFGVISNGASLIVEPQPSGAPFACDANLYESETIGATTRLFQVDTGVVPYARNEFAGAGYAPSAAYRYSGLAWHPQENYLYAIVTESNNAVGVPVVGSVVRIDQGGDVVNLGLPERGPNTMTMPVVSDRFVGGTFTSDGKYVVVTDLNAVSNSGVAIPPGERGLILEIDVSVNPPQVLFNRQHNRDVGDIVGHPNGSLYSHTSGDGLITIDAQSGTVTPVGGNVNSRLSGLAADNWGRLFAHTESTGDLIEIDPATGNGTLLSALAGGASADAAACSYGLSARKEVSVSQIETGNAVTYTVTVVNAGDSATGFSFSDDLQDARTFVAGSVVNPFGGTVNNYADTNLLTIGGASLAANSSATLQFEVFYPPGVPAGISTNQAFIQAAGSLPVGSDYPTTPEIGDVTPVEVLPSPAIGVSKRAEVAGNEVAYFFTVENTGSADLDELSLEDDLDAVFGGGNYQIIGSPVLILDPGGVTVNAAFNGSGANTFLIDDASGSTLAVGERLIIRLTVVVDTLSDQGLGFGVYSNQVKVGAVSPGGSNVSDVSVDGDLVDPDGNGVADEQSPTLVNLAASITLSGVVFEDNGASGVAHDGLPDSAEPPLSGVVVELRDNGGVLIDSTITATDGSYSFSVPASYAGSSLQVVTLANAGFSSISENVTAATTGDVTDGSVVITPGVGVANSYVAHFGRVRHSQWLSDSVVENLPGTGVIHRHTYRAYTSGDVTFSVASEQSVPSNADFSSVLIHDINCNGAIDGIDGSVTALVVTEGTEVCVINKVYIPATASLDDTYTTILSATMNYQDAAGTGHSLSSTLEVTDITRSLSGGQGVLVLGKTVQNVTEGSVETSRNSANPDDVLRYSIDFNNNGTGPVTEVLIADTVPAYSSLEQPVQCPPSLPVGIATCAVVSPSAASNTPGYSGPVQWQFDGTLQAGAGGRVWFEVRVE